MSVTWKQLTNSPGNYAEAMWLMQDGTILAYLNGGTQLMRLYPDASGSYADGSWFSAGNFLLEKQFFGSAVLSDGRVVACGGEDSGPSLSVNDTNFCEIYDPFGEGPSTSFPPPENWAAIGDAPSVVLNDGTFMLGSNPGRYGQVALLNSSTLTWTVQEGDSYIEQGYTLLQTGEVLTVSTQDQSSIRYDSSGSQFVTDAPPPVILFNSQSEIGPAITMMDGNVICFGATGHACIYVPGGEGHDGSWVAVNDLPTSPESGKTLATGDCSAILEPNGKVLLLADPQTSTFSSAFVEYDPIQQFGPILIGAPIASYRDLTRMLLLPNGHGLVSIAGSGEWYDLTFDPGYDPTWAPTITSFPSTVTTGTTVTLEGTQLCGLSECQSMGDDNQQSENYPMVRFEGSSGSVTYARAHDVSTRSIAPGEPATVRVDIPNMAPGTYTAYVVAMGIPSQGFAVNVLSPPTNCQTVAKDIWQLIAKISPLDIPLSIREILRREILGCERQLGAAETGALLTSLFPPQPPLPRR